VKPLTRGVAVSEIPRIMRRVKAAAHLTLDAEHSPLSDGDRRLRRLSYDLHDGPLQELVALAEELRLAAGQIDGVVPEADRERVRGRFQDIEARLGALEESLREIVHGGRVASSVHGPLDRLVRVELTVLEETGTAVEFHADGDLDDLTDSQKIAIVRIVQEGVTNVRRHSDATSVSVVLQGTDEATELTITDDGRGFDVDALGHGRLGLAGVADRVRMLGGDVKIESTPNQGATLWARLPRWRPSQTDENRVRRELRSN
jgi:signal transduction histidine kinase